MKFDFIPITLRIYINFVVVSVDFILTLILIKWLMTINRFSKFKLIKAYV